MPFFIITIGASAGGRDAICKLVAALPPDLNAAVFIVLHIAKQGLDNFLIHRLQKCTALPCQLVVEGLPIKQGHIYIAQINHHLIVRRDVVHITKGPSENRWRPSIDVLFRSAAVHYNEQVIGIILTGLLDDGTAGMQAIKRCGGTCIVQDPREAEYPDMPQSVLDNTMVDYILPVAGMPEAIQNIIDNKILTGVEVPEDIKLEAAMEDRMATTIDDMTQLGNHSIYTCPDCGGGLWEIKDGEHTRYRCHIGHAFSENDLLRKQFESLNGTLWVALRVMEERRNLLNRISKNEKKKNMDVLAEIHTGMAKELEEHISKLKELLLNVNPG
jgi:two-component system chemotaxis response regulator CheB